MFSGRSQKTISVKNAKLHNLKNVSLEIPLNKFVVVVGPSGGGKTSLIYDILYKKSQGSTVDCDISVLPKMYALAQKITLPKNEKLSLGQYNLKTLKSLIKKISRGEVLIVDEPCAGFTAKESTEIVGMLKTAIKKKGISVIAIEHSREVICRADYVIEFGPGSGRNGGKVTFQGDLKKFKKSSGITAKYVFLNKVEKLNYRRNPNSKAIKSQRQFVEISKIKKHNLNNYNVKFPLSSLICISGKSGSGKTVLLKFIYGVLYKGKNAWQIREKSNTYQSISGKENVRRTYFIEQVPIGRNPRSNLVTYLNIWHNLRALFVDTKEAKKNNFTISDFLINRLNKDVLSIKYKKKNIRQVLGLTVDEAIELFSKSAIITRKLKFLQEVGLGYVTLGQQTGTLSGGEAQRVRLAQVLSKKLSDRCVYLLDVPTRGLHLSDIPIILKVFQKIIDKNNTIMVADNKAEMINNSDYLIKL